MKHLETLIDVLGRTATDWGSRALFALGILVSGWFLARYAERALTRYGQRVAHLDPTLVPFAARVLHWVVIAMTAVAALGKFGVDTSSILAVLGAAGLAVGLALKDTMSDIASGLVLLVLRPFDVGDLVGIDGTQGTVTAIDVFETHLTSVEGVPLVLPNTKVRAAKIENFSRAEVRRIALTVSISYADDIGRALTAMRETVAQEARILATPAPVINVNDLGATAVNLLCQAHTRAPDFQATKMDLARALKERLHQEGVTLAPPNLRDIPALPR